MHVPRRLIRRVGAVQVPVVRRRARPARAFDLFTERARDAMVLAQEEARRLGHDYLGTEHLLLGLLRQKDAMAGRILKSMGVKLGEARSAVEAIIGRGQIAAPGELPITPRLKRVLELSVAEAKGLRHNYVGTEHLLIAIAREGESVGARVLARAGATADLIRAEIERVVGRGIGKRS